MRKKLHLENRQTDIEVEIVIQIHPWYVCTIVTVFRAAKIVAKLLTMKLVQYWFQILMKKP